MMTIRVSPFVLVTILSNFIMNMSMVSNAFATSTTMMTSAKHTNIHFSSNVLESLKKDSGEHVSNIFTLSEPSSNPGTRNLKKNKMLKKKERISDECRQDERAKANLLEFLQLSNDTMYFDIAGDVMYYDRDYCEERKTTAVYCDFSDAPWMDEIRDDCMSLNDQQLVYATLRVNDFDDGKTVIMDGALCLPMSCDPVEYGKFLSNAVTLQVKKEKRNKKLKGSL
jgi:hypothetical protein